MGPPTNLKKMAAKRFEEILERDKRKAENQQQLTEKEKIETIQKLFKSLTKDNRLIVLNELNSYEDSALNLHNAIVSREGFLKNSISLAIERITYIFLEGCITYLLIR
jgi:hypothetical protein